MRVSGARALKARILFPIPSKNAQLTKHSVCCIYHKPKAVDESSDDSSDSSSSSDEDSDADNTADADRKGKEHACGHNHGSGRSRGKKRQGGKKQKRPPSPNAYEKVPKPKPKDKSGETKS